MENLVGRKVKIIYYFIGVTIGKEYEIVDNRNGLITIIEDNGKEQCYGVDHINNGNLKLVPEEWEPKQGDKVLASDDGVNYTETPIIFISKHKDYFVTESKKSNKILKWKYIKPYKEEIKVGDWVFRKTDNIAVFKYDYKFIEHLDELIKITDKELIKKLNEL